MAKIVVIGPKGAGKSAFSIRLATNEFNATLVKGPNTQCFIAAINAKKMGSIPLYIWDSECHPQRMSALLQTSDVIFCLFSLADRSSLLALKESILTHELVAPFLKSKQKMLCFIGTHADCPRHVSQKEIDALVVSTNSQYFSASSKSGANFKKIDSFVKKCCVHFYENKLAQRKTLLPSHLYSANTMQNTYLEKAQKECGYLWKDEQGAQKNIQAILHDYALNNNGWRLFYYQHANRHHTYAVSVIVRKIKSGEFSSVSEILLALNDIKDIKKGGSLSLRLAFINNKLRLNKNNPRNNVISELGTPRASNGLLGCFSCVPQG